MVLGLKLAINYKIIYICSIIVFNKTNILYYLLVLFKSTFMCINTMDTAVSSAPRQCFMAVLHGSPPQQSSMAVIHGSDPWQ